MNGKVTVVAILEPFIHNILLILGTTLSIIIIISQLELSISVITVVTLQNRKTHIISKHTDCMDI